MFSQLGSTALAIKCAEGVVLAVEKRISSSLLIPSSIEKIVEVDGHIGLAMSGLVADAKMLVEHARTVSQSHTFTYAEKIRVESLTQSVCDLALRFGEGAHGETKRLMARPFGIALLIAGWDADTNSPVLFHTDPSGTFARYEAKAIGAGSEGANSELLEAYAADMTFEQAETLAIKILKTVMEENLNATNVEIASVTKNGFYSYGCDEINALIERIK